MSYLLDHQVWMRPIDVGWVGIGGVVVGAAAAWALMRLRRPKRSCCRRV